MPTLWKILFPEIVVLLIDMGPPRTDNTPAPFGDVAKSDTGPGAVHSTFGVSLRTIVLSVMVRSAPLQTKTPPPPRALFSEIVLRVIHVPPSQIAIPPPAHESR